MIPPRFSHLIELLEHRAQEQPDALALGFLENDIRPSLRLSYLSLIHI